MPRREFKQDMDELRQMDLYLIRLGEISLKGMNRNFFEKKLKNNIKLKIHPYRSTLTREKGRFYLYVSKECPHSGWPAAQTTLQIDPLPSGGVWELTDTAPP